MTNFKLSILRNVFSNCIAVVKLFGVHNRTKNKVEKQVQWKGGRIPIDGASKPELSHGFHASVSHNYCKNQFKLVNRYFVFFSERSPQKNLEAKR